MQLMKYSIKYEMLTSPTHLVAAYLHPNYKKFKRFSKSQIKEAKNIITAYIDKFSS